MCVGGGGGGGGGGGDINPILILLPMNIGGIWGGGYTKSHLWIFRRGMLFPTHTCIFRLYIIVYIVHVGASKLA